MVRTVNNFREAVCVVIWKNYSSCGIIAVECLQKALISMQTKYKLAYTLDEAGLIYHIGRTRDRNK